MSVENLQNKINDKLEKRIATLEKTIIGLAYPNKNNELKTTNKILTSLLVVLYGESKLTSKTDNEKKAVVNAIVKDINFINPLINDWIIFYNWLLINCFNRCLFNES